jgi:hypothetical protein
VTTGRGGSAGPTGATTVGGLTIQPARRVVSGVTGSAWTSPGSPLMWRALYTAAAAAYVGVFHFSLPGGIATVGRSGGSLPHGHGMAVALYIASWMILIHSARDVVSYAWPHTTPASALHEAL